MTSPMDTHEGLLAKALTEIAEACEKAVHPAAGICLSESHLSSLQQISAKARVALRHPAQAAANPCSDDDVVACANAGKQMIAAGPALTGTSEDTTQGDRPAATVKVRSSEHPADPAKFNELFIALPQSERGEVMDPANEHRLAGAQVTRPERGTP